MKSLYKADLHVHSSYSNKPTYWALRKFNCPESYTSPRFVYDTARKLGMDYVTISDHNTINGALEIAHLPGVFVSSEITSYFPENGCKVHVVVVNITESQFRLIIELRKNVYEMVAYLQREGIAHFMAHPLYAQNDKLTIDIIEKALVLFATFEVKNGCRARRFNAFTEQVVAGLDAETLERLANRHDIHPYGATPWIKGMVGGSDDHGGLFISRAHTAVDGADTLDAFIKGIMEGKSRAEGDDGGPLTMAHSMYGIAYSFYRERFGERRRSSTPFISALMNRFFNVGSARETFIEKIRLFILKNIPESLDYRGRSFEEVLDREARALLNDNVFLATLKGADQNRTIFAVTSYLVNRMIYIYTSRLMSLPLSAGFFDYVTTLSTIGLVHLLVSPYYLAFHHQHKGKDIMRGLQETFPDAGNGGGGEKIALFTDTLDEINGVAITIRRLIRTARNRGVELTVITAGDAAAPFPEGVKRFESVGDFVLPEYPELKLSFPPILDVMDYIEKGGFTRIHVSTPGTVGLLGLLISRIMDIPVAGTYHTDIPQYVRSLTNDEFLEQAAWSYMIWFYNQMEEVMVPSNGTRQQLMMRGLPEDKMKPLPRWVDTEQFTPVRRKQDFWTSRGIPEGIRLLYVGRVSREKSLELLAETFCELIDAGFDASLVIVGDGPYRQDMETRLKEYPAFFTGYLEGEELLDGYASADLFVFPSATDTFGNVVLEAQSSGLPVIVSDAGGPKELMVNGETGMVFSAGSGADLAAAIRHFLNNRDVLAEMGRNARIFTLNSAPAAGDVYSTILQSSRAV